MCLSPFSPPPPRARRNLIFVLSNPAGLSSQLLPHFCLYLLLFYFSFRSAPVRTNTLALPFLRAKTFPALAAINLGKRSLLGSVLSREFALLRQIRHSVPERKEALAGNGKFPLSNPPPPPPLPSSHCCESASGNKGEEEKEEEGVINCHGNAPRHRTTPACRCRRRQKRRALTEIWRERAEFRERI